MDVEDAYSAPSASDTESDEVESGGEAAAEDEEEAGELEEEDGGDAEYRARAPQKGARRVGRDRLCSRTLTRFERATIVARRAEELEKGAPPLVALPSFDAVETARAEMRAGLLHFVIRRFNADGSYEDWDLEELA